MIAYGSNCLISQEWLASLAEGDSIINATLLYLLYGNKSPVRHQGTNTKDSQPGDCG